MSIGINGKWVIAYDGQRHRLLRDGVVVVEGNRVTHVGKSYKGDVERWIDARHHVVIPGMICTHTHAASAPKDKSFIDDTGARHFYMSSLGENLTALGKSIKPEDFHTFARYSMSELLRSGCTTMLEIGMVGTLGAKAAVRHIQELGIRAVEGRGVEDGRWTRSDTANLYTEWMEESGDLEFREQRLLGSFKSDPRFLYIEVEPWKGYFRGRFQPRRYEGFLERVMAAYAEKAQAQPESAALLERYREAAAGEYAAVHGSAGEEE